MLGKVFGVITLVSLSFGIAGGNGEGMASAVLEGASRAIQLTLTLGGMMCLWCGVMRVLEQKQISYTAHAYPADGPIDGVSVAAYLGQDPQQVFKTLVTKAASGAY